MKKYNIFLNLVVTPLQSVTFGFCGRLVSQNLHPKYTVEPQIPE